MEDDSITQEERDARTVFIMQLARNVTIRDIQDFFSKVGQVRDVRLISDRNSRRSKGIGYVEFTDPSAVTLVGTKFVLQLTLLFNFIIYIFIIFYITAFIFCTFLIRQ